MNSYREQSQLLKALAHPVRLQILDALREESQCVCHLTALLNKRQAYISQQLAVLREAGLVVDEKEGLNVFYRVSDERVFQVMDALREPSDGREEGKAAILRLQQRATEPLAGCPCPKCTGVDMAIAAAC
jgi:ArsR family transcriptional regulator